MPAFYEITYLPEGRVARFAGSRGNYYEFPDATRLDVHTAPVWCHPCGRVTHGEVIPPLAELDKELADLDDPASDLYRLTMRPLLPEFEAPDFRETFRAKRIEETRRRRVWRLNRRSPPKCIHCGSADILPLSHGQPVAVAAGPVPLTVVVRCTGMCSTDFNEWFFTPEGDRIPRDTKPTYWHLPGVDPTAETSVLRRLLKRLAAGKGVRGRDADGRGAGPGMAP